MIAIRPMAILSAVIGCHILPLQTANASITLNDGGASELQVVARDGSISLVNVITSNFPTSLPFTAPNQSTTHGGSTSEADYSLTQNLFSIVNEGTRAGALDSRANSQGDIFFSVDIDTLYDLSGSFSVNDPSTTGRFVQLVATLTDIDTSAVLFHSLQESSGAADVTFVLGGMGGNVSNQLAGSAAGLLSAGHRYRLYYGNSIYADNAGMPASATGDLQMRFAAVPEISTVVTWGVLGLFAGAMVYTRERRLGLIAAAR
jgi:hypothetical protein